jgi:hypothetical protein
METNPSIWSIYVIESKNGHKQFKRWYFTLAPAKIQATLMYNRIDRSCRSEYIMLLVEEQLTSCGQRAAKSGVSSAESFVYENSEWSKKYRLHPKLLKKSFDESF